MADPRKFCVEKDKTLPEIDMTANYAVKNRTFGPIGLTIVNPQRNKMETMTLGGRKEAIIPGSRMTNFVFELESRGILKVVKQQA